MTRGHRIRAFREHLGMNKKEFAQALGLTSHASVINYEDHNRLPERPVIKRLLELAQEKNYLLTRDHIYED